MQATNRTSFSPHRELDYLSSCIPVSNQFCCWQISDSYIVGKSQDFGSADRKPQLKGYGMLSFVNFLPIVAPHWPIPAGQGACRTDSDHHEIRE
jgi:hypothetical protein